MKKILITGEHSYIGTSFKNWVNKYKGRYKIETINVKNDKWKEKSFYEFDVVLHVAGIAHIKETKENKDLYYKINRDLAYEIAKKSKTEGVKQFIQLSSMSVFGIDKGIITSNTIPCPKSSYGKSKFQAEKLIMELKDEEFNVAIIRPPMVYGKNCRGNYNILSKFALKTPIFPNIKNQRSMIYIDNLCEFIRLIIDDRAFGLFHPQNEEYICTSDMIMSISSYHKKKIKLIPIFNPFIKRINIGIINKVFGTLIYDKSMSTYKSRYCIVDFNNSIYFTEGVD